MRFSFTDDQLLFRDAVKDLLQRECTPEVVRAAWHSDTGRTESVWAKLTEMGVTGMLAAEADGGLGMALIDQILLHEEAGRVCLPEPLIGHGAAAVPALGDSTGSASEAWTDVLAGRAVAVSTSLHPLLEYADQATWLIAEVPAPAAATARQSELRIGLLSQLELVEVEALDRSRRLFRLVSPLRDWGDPIAATPDSMNNRGAVAAAAQSVGVAQALIDHTVAYVAQRNQFGKAVGTYQAVKHHLANAALAVEFARPMVYQAAWTLGQPDAAHDWDRDVSAAKVLASDAVDLACRVALQCHGAIGYTYEYDLQLWLKRGWTLAAAWGDAHWHRQRVGAALGLSNPTDSS